MSELREIKFGELRRMISVIDRISMCMEETSQYENFLDIKDVPEKYDEMYVCGIGGTDSEFPVDDSLHFMPCLEILVSKKTRTEFEESMRQKLAERRKRRESRDWMTISGEKMDKLAEKFPFMIDRKYNESLYCDITDEWYPLLENLCQEIADEYEQAGLPMDLCVVDVKQEWGSLSFDFRFENENVIVDTAERVRELHHKIVEIVLFYEDKSTSVCEECGQPGKVRDDSSFRITLCDDCFEKIKANRRARVCFD